MDTVINSVFTTAPSASVKTISRVNLAPFWQAIERDRFGMTPLFLVIAACLGGFAAAVSVQYSIIVLSIVGLSTGLVAVMLIAVMPMRITFLFFVAALLIDLLVFLS
ncbi:hypothetical protein BH11BAC1_BH11BAC1_07310 [soil metagenome]